MANLSTLHRVFAEVSVLPPDTIAQRKLGTWVQYYMNLCLSFWRTECVDLAPGLTGALYLKHFKNVLKNFQKFILKVCTYRQ
jgi:hypothetical protein